MLAVGRHKKSQSLGLLWGGMAPKAFGHDSASEGLVQRQQIQRYLAA